MRGEEILLEAIGKLPEKYPKIIGTPSYWGISKLPEKHPITGKLGGFNAVIAFDCRERDKEMLTYHEVKFLLDPEQVLDEEHRLKKEWEQAFGITEEFVPYEVVYMETPEQDFRREEWYNRLRRKSGKKKVERTFKELLDEKGILLHEDSLKTGMILDAGLSH